MTSSETTFNDEELIARLRDSVSGEHDMTPHGADVLQAADRIEELLAKLAKAVEALGQAATDMDDYVGRGYGDCFRETLAEIKGEKP